MRKILLTTLSVLTILSSVRANPSEIDYDKKMEWWREAKFGMFVHWGPYCLYGGEYNGFRQHRGGAEWIMNRCKIPVAEYRAKASTFNPVDFNADSLVLLAKQAGMKYMVFTTKHHDGFAMFRSEASNFNIVDYTHFGRDIVDEIAQACRRHGMKLGFYYSQSQDWCNPGGATARKEMWEGWANPDSTYINNFTASHGGAWDHRQFSVSFDEYFHTVSLPQIRELLTRYEDVAVMWWDTPMGISDELARKITDELSAYPQVITNDRLKRPNFPGDYSTPEGKIPKLEDVVGVDWETCANIGSSWGYKSYEANWKSSHDLIRNLITIAARGGNYLLNVGPTPSGSVPGEAVERLKEMGKWLDVWGEAVYGTWRSPIHPQWGDCTRRDKGNSTTLYLCVFDWPADGTLLLEADYAVKKASMLDSGITLRTKKTSRGIEISVPGEAPDTVASVIKLELRKKLPKEKLVSNSNKYFEIVDEQ